MAVERTMSILRKAVVTAGVAVAFKKTFEELRRSDSPTRNLVLEQVGNLLGYKARLNPDNVLIQIPGPLRSAGVTAALLAEPNRTWNKLDHIDDSLACRLDPTQTAQAFCIETIPSDLKRFPHLYLIKEYGDPINNLPVPGTKDTYTIPTIRYFLAGKRFVPPRLQIAEDTSN